MERDASCQKDTSSSATYNKVSGGPKVRYLEEDVSSWSVDDVIYWLEFVIGLPEYTYWFKQQRIDGLALLLVTETDLKKELNVQILGDVKRIYASISQLHQDVFDASSPQPLHECIFAQSHKLTPLTSSGRRNHGHLMPPNVNAEKRSRTYSSDSQTDSMTGISTQTTGHMKTRGAASNLRPEYLKTLVSCLYMFLVTWVTAIVMVFVHDRVPDKERHPPLPDIFLDNVPHISWAFELCEITILILSITMLFILYFHQHRSILMRRFSALSGSVFLLRCATMFITSLSVPGHHLECAPREETDIWTKLHMASIIWRGGGLSIKGVRTCGDYMFSGHTTALTLLNFFITEYTPRRIYYLHIVSWVLNTFGIFFILAAHEHYSIDVFIAFYITSRMFLYYHSLANNRALHQRDSFRTKIWFPMFSYFEAHIDGIVPNVYANPLCKRNFVWFSKKLILWVSKIKILFSEITTQQSPTHDKKNY